MKVISILEYQIEKAAIQSLANFGTPECYYCGFCGKKCDSKEEMITHLEANSEGECGDA